jgi:hypothetical protein
VVVVLLVALLLPLRRCLLLHLRVLSFLPTATLLPLIFILIITQSCWVLLRPLCCRLLNNIVQHLNLHFVHLLFVTKQQQ